MRELVVWEAEDTILLVLVYSGTKCVGYWEGVGRYFSCLGRKESSLWF